MISKGCAPAQLFATDRPSSRSLSNMNDVSYILYFSPNRVERGSSMKSLEGRAQWRGRRGESCHMVWKIISIFQVLSEGGLKDSSRKTTLDTPVFFEF